MSRDVQVGQAAGYDACERSWRQTNWLLERGIVEPWGKRRLSSIRRPEIVALLDRIADRAPVTANRTLAAFHHLCVWALERGLVEANPCSGIRAPARPEARERTLDDGELRALWTAAVTLGYPCAPIVKMLALTGSRLREVAEMRWSEVDIDKAAWTLPAARSKNGREHAVPLSSQAIEILEGLPRFAGCDAVFTYDAKAPVSSLSRAKRSLDEAMRTELGELTPFVIHDIRRSVASGMAELGVAPHVIEASLNHRSGVVSGLAATYNRYTYVTEKRAALQRWADHVEGLVTGAEASNVVELSLADAKLAKARAS